MSTFTNKDLEQFGNVLNTLINEIKNSQGAIKVNTDKISLTTERYIITTIKNQQQTISQFEQIHKVLSKPADQAKSINFEIDLKKDFNKK